MEYSPAMEESGGDEIPVDVNSNGLDRNSEANEMTSFDSNRSALERIR
jgi:hypothetical protein